jgi:DNA-directed RNA polymerase subunit M
MDFCNKCDSLLSPKKIGNKVVPFCPDCNESKENGSLGKISFEDEERKNDPEGGKMLIIEDDSNAVTGRSRKEMICPKCQTIETIEYWEIQTRSADESPTRFFRCLTCEKNWREYD